MELLLLTGCTIFGAVLGSFIGVVSERVHTGQSWARGRSRCNSCNKELASLELIPILSFLAAYGRCFTCGARVPAGYLALEGTLAALFALSFLKLGPTVLLGVLFAFLGVLAFIVVYDIRHTIVPSEASTALVLLGVVYAAFASPTKEIFGLSLFIAGVLGLAFVVFFVASRGRAMGLGDAPVALALALVGGGTAFPGLLFSFWIGALYGIAVLLLRRGGPTMGIEVPFVPFLATGFLLAYFSGWNPLALSL